MRRVVRYLSVVVAITLMLTAESVSIATAAVPPLQPIPGVASVSPANGAVVGVAHPVVVTFTTPVTDRRAVERSIRISTPHNTTGHFEWVASNVVRWVPHRYWPPHTRVSVGVQELTEGFETGDALIGVASISAHTFTVSRNGEVLRTMPASLGKPSRPTPIGSFHAMSKERTVVMDSHPAEFLGRVSAHRPLRGSCYLERRVRALGPLVGQLAGIRQRQPRLYQPQPGQRGMVLRRRHRW